MGQIIHPNQFPLVQSTLQEEDDISGRMSAALQFLEGIDYEEDSLRLRRRRRAERTAAATVSSMAGVGSMSR